MLALAACGDGTAGPSVPIGGPCRTDADCQSGLLCRGDVCQDPAASVDAGPPLDGGVALDGGEDAGTLQDGGALADGGADDAGFGDGGLGFGARCNQHGDCQSQICLQLPSGAFCSRPCRNDCPQDNVCKGYVLEGNRIVNLCVPFSEVYCVACTTSRDCPNAGDRCTHIGGANYCTRDCSADNACAAGYDCTTVPFADTVEGQPTDGGAATDPDAGALRQCLPRGGACPGCIDRDGDGYGAGTGCLGPDCDDTHRDIHPGAAELCDGIDNNCDGRRDEGFALDTDRQNCGACGVTCNAGADDQCCSGRCVRTDAAREHCGACGITCGDGEVCCQGACRSLLTDVNHCGACQQACSNAHGTTSCASSVCQPSCESGFGDCDTNPRNGCETPVSTVDHCGRCDVVCVNPNGETRCVRGECAPTCQPNFGNCDRDPNNGCETPLLTTAAHCGACAQPCVNPHGAVACVEGLCAPTCEPGYGNCDANTRNGCETDLAVTTEHCGGCGTACANNNGTTRCEGSRCIPTCSPGFADCNGNPRDGCETTLAGVSVCGACVVDAECPGGFYCAANVCTRKLPRGDACTEARQCASGFCVDGVCCDTDCSGTCRSCRQLGNVGTCTLFSAGVDPEDECVAEPASTCGQDGVCDGFGGCRLHGSGTVCVAQSCAAGLQRDTERCDGAGHCIAPLPPVTFCNPYVCTADGTACNTACVTDAECGVGYACSNGQCRVEIGAACQSGADCATGFCADGVCCTAPCDGVCEVCNLPGSVGRCEAVPAGSDPDNECEGQAQSTCGRTGACSGTRGRCQLYPQDAQCAPQTCEAGIQTNARTCDGAGTCTTPSRATIACTPYACKVGGDTCRDDCADDAQCAPLYACTDGECKLRQGQTCTADTDCHSGFCTGGVCCESRCGGTCERCNGPGRRGFCDPLPSPPNVTCGSATSLGALRAGDGLGTGVQSIAVEGEEHWYVATFPMSTMLFGGGEPRVRLLRNDDDAFRLQIVGRCGGPALACTPDGDAAAIVDWSFTDDQSLAGENQWSTRNTPWPAEVFFRVIRTTSGRSCAAYQVRISR